MEFMPSYLQETNLILQRLFLQPQNLTQTKNNSSIQHFQNTDFSTDNEKPSHMQLQNTSKFSKYRP